MFKLYSGDFVNRQLVYSYRGGFSKEIQRSLFALFIVLVFVQGRTDAQRISEAQCASVDGVDSPCVNILQCKVLLKVLRRRPISPEAADGLRQLQCGYDGDKPKVCCPPNKLLPKLNECGEETMPNKIVGGRNTDINEYPWMALLEYTKPNGKDFHCGGSLISTRYVLTAAHCVSNPNLNDRIRLTGVRLGEWDLSSARDCIGDDCSDPPVDVPIESTLVHENYNMSDVSQPNDIALLRLAFPVSFTEYIRPVCLPVISQLASTRSFVGQDLTVAGWGNTGNGWVAPICLPYFNDPKLFQGNAETIGWGLTIPMVPSYSAVLQTVHVPIMSEEQCRAKEYKALAVGTFCAGGVKDEDSCNGDSGGPLLKVNDHDGFPKYYAIGIVSFGPALCGNGRLGAYTNISSHMHWILSNIDFSK